MIWIVIAWAIGIAIWGFAGRPRIWQQFAPIRDIDAPDDTAWEPDDVIEHRIGGGWRAR